MPSAIVYIVFTLFWGIGPTPGTFAHQGSYHLKWMTGTTYPNSDVVATTDSTLASCNYYVPYWQKKNTLVWPPDFQKSVDQLRAAGVPTQVTVTCEYTLAHGDQYWTD